MKLLLDQDVYESTAKLLIELGYDVLRVRDLGMARAEDEENLAKALELGRVFVTRDRDYGNLVFVHGIRCGVIYLRPVPSTLASVHSELARVLTEYEMDDIRTAFVTVEPGRHRFRRI